MKSQTQIVRREPTEVFMDKYKYFVGICLEAEGAVQSLSRGNPHNNEVTDVRSFSPDRLRYLGENLEPSLEEALDYADATRTDPEVRKFRDRLLLAGGSRLDDLGNRCKMYALYLKDRGRNGFVDSGELSRLAYLPKTDSYYIEGEKRKGFLRRVLSIFGIGQR